MNSNEGLNGPAPEADRSEADAGLQEGPQPNVGNHADERAMTKHRPTIVGIGASAGGLHALKTFFSHVPEDSNLAFVVVVHLSPKHESHLSDLLQPHVNIPVEQVSDTTSIEANHV